MTQGRISFLLAELRQDPAIWAYSPDCGHKYRLAESDLFYGGEIPESALKFLRKREEELKDLRLSAKKLRAKHTTELETRSSGIRLGDTLENVCTVLPDFPYEARDCRPLFNPIDYLVFMGLARGKISRVGFVEVKTGRSRLLPIQKEIRDAVCDGRVQVRRVQE